MTVKRIKIIFNPIQFNSNSVLICRRQCVFCMFLLINGSLIYGERYLETVVFIEAHHESISVLLY